MKKVLGVLLTVIFLFPSQSYASVISNSLVCNQYGSYGGYSPFSAAPTYDYGSDGLVRFHFTLDPNYGGWVHDNVTFWKYDNNCNFLGIGTYTYDSAGTVPGNVSHILLKAEEIYPGVFAFYAFDEDTNLPINLGAFPPPFTSPVIGVSILQTQGASNVYGYIEYGARSPIVSVKINKQESKKTPVLIVPGILGTDIKEGSNKLWANLGLMATDIGDDFMDPLQFGQNLTPSKTDLNPGNLVLEPFPGQHFYDLVIQEFENQGYIQSSTSSDASLFTFPYDWRYGVSGKYSDGSTNADLLKQKIDEIRQQTGSDKVDIVAHSMGGLIVKKYIQDNANNYLNKVVFVGVPNLGAPKATKVFIEGDGFGIPWLADGEMQKISQNLPAVYDLSPSLKYIQNNGSYFTKYVNQIGQTLIQKFDQNQTQNYLLAHYNLNDQGMYNSNILHSQYLDGFEIGDKVPEFYNIVGCKSGTIGQVNEKWSERQNTEYFTGFSLDDTTGDGTVPLGSADTLQTDSGHKFYAIKADHAKMLSADGIRQQIVNIISGSSLHVGSNIISDQAYQSDPKQCQLKGHWWQIFSPLNIEVTDQNGNRAGLATDGSIQNDIPGADYEIMGEHKFVFVPTDENQTYTADIIGTGTGTFTFKDEYIDGGDVKSTDVFSNLPVIPSLKGTINLGNTTTLSLDNDGDGTVDQVVEPSSVLNTDESEDLIPPVTTAAVFGTQGNSGFYRSNVELDLSANDQVISGNQSQTSGILATRYRIDDSSYVLYNSLSPIVISSEGSHTITYFSTDRAGNNELEQSIAFTIDKNAPELSFVFDPTSLDVVFSGIDNISSTNNLQVMDSGDVVTVTDEAGNITTLNMKDKDRKSKMKMDVTGLLYNNVAQDISKTSASFSWTINSNSLRQQIKSAPDYLLDAWYKNGSTTITGKDVNGKINVTTIGLQLFKVSSSKGNFVWSI